MKYLVVILLLVFTTTTSVAANKTAAKVPDVSMEELSKKYTEDLKKLSSEQRDLMIQIAELAYGFDLAYTAVAIAWQESNLGKYPVNLSDPSCGIFHKLVEPYLKGRDRKIDSFRKNQACSELISSTELSVAVFLEDIEYWRLAHKRRGTAEADILSYAIRSYNAGYKYKSKDAEAYEKSVKARILSLKRDLQFQLTLNKLRANKSK